MSVVDVAKAFNELCKNNPACERVTMKLDEEKRTIQIFKFYIIGREQPIEVSCVGTPAPDQLALEARKQLA